MWFPDRYWIICDSVCDSFDCIFFFIHLKETKLVDLGTIKLLKDCLCDDILYYDIMIGLVGVSALKSLKTYIKRFNNLFFVFISSGETTLMIHLEKSLIILLHVYVDWYLVPVIICITCPFLDNYINHYMDMCIWR